MTLVVTTASRFGITLVGDRAVSHLVGGQPPTVADQEARKVFHSAAANIALACWGNTDCPGVDYFTWLNTFVDGDIRGGMSLREVAVLLGQRLTAQLQPLADERHGRWSSLRRGIHLSGYVDGVPCIYHVHTGAPERWHHNPRPYFDYPDEYGGSMETYKAGLASGAYAQLFNGFHELFGVVGESIKPLRERLEEEFELTIPAPTLRAQLEYSRALVRFAAGMLRAADRAPQVSTEVDVIAFNDSGRQHIAELTPDLPPLKAGAKSGVTFTSVFPLTQSLWGGGHHTDTPHPDPNA